MLFHVFKGVEQLWMSQPLCSQIKEQFLVNGLNLASVSGIALNSAVLSLTLFYCEDLDISCLLHVFRGLKRMELGWSTLTPSSRPNDHGWPGVSDLQLREVKLYWVEGLANLHDMVLSTVKVLKLDHCAKVDLMLIFHVFSNIERIEIRNSTLIQPHLPNGLSPSDEQHDVITELSDVEICCANDLPIMNGIHLSTAESLVLRLSKRHGKILASHVQLGAIAMTVNASNSLERPPSEWCGMPLNSAVTCLQLSSFYEVDITQLLHIFTNMEDIEIRQSTLAEPHLPDDKLQSDRCREVTASSQLKKVGFLRS